MITCCYATEQYEPSIPKYLSNLISQFGDNWSKISEQTSQKIYTTVCNDFKNAFKKK